MRLSIYLRIGKPAVLLILFLNGCSRNSQHYDNAGINDGIVIHAYSSKLMDGFPPDSINLVTLDNWDVVPYNRWAYQHFRELVPTQNISRGTQQPILFKRETLTLDTLRFPDSNGNSISIREMLDTSSTDGFLVMKDDKIIMEEYFSGMSPSSLHLLQSASKVFLISLIAIALEEGTVSQNQKVKEYIPELRNSGFSEVTVGQLMDMQSGIHYSFGLPSYTSSEFYRHLQSWLWKPGREANKGHRHFLTTLENESVPGEAFSYHDANTEVLNWILEKTYRKTFAELFSERIWSKIGVEHDAFISCDGLGSAVTSGGINVTLRDFARMGRLFLNKGKSADAQIIPHDFFDSIINTMDTLIFARSVHAPGFSKGSAYNDHFWIPGGHDGAFVAFGYQGQYLYIHPKHHVAIAKFSTQSGSARGLRRTEWNGFHAIAKALDSARSDE